MIFHLETAIAARKGGDEGYLYSTMLFADELDVVGAGMYEFEPYSSDLALVGSEGALKQLECIVNLVSSVA